MGSRTRGLSSCGMQAQVLCGMLNPPRLGLEPTSPALAGGFLTTGPPEKSSQFSNFEFTLGEHLLTENTAHLGSSQGHSMFITMMMISALCKEFFFWFELLEKLAMVSISPRSHTE